MKLWELISGAPAAALLGMCKNAGKTTALNRLIREFSRESGGTLGVTSIGRDGEGRDLVTGTDKPPIWLREGMLAATAAGLLPLGDVSREILASTGIYTSLGEVILFRARSDGFVQLAGPAIVEQLGTLRKMFTEFGADQVLIDGALSRRSPLAGVTDGACILSTGASLDRDMDRVVTETAFTAKLLGLPEIPAMPEGEEAEPDLIRLPGAFTQARAEAMIRDGKKKDGRTLIVRDASCLMLKRESYERLQAQGLRFAVEHGSRLAAVTVNPVSAGGWRFDADVFLEKMRAAVNVPVLDVMRE